MNIHPLYDNVVVKRKEQKNISEGGIVLPGSATEQPNQGEVIAIGKGTLLDNGEIRKLQVKIGDTVVFGSYSGNTIKLDGNELMIMRENEIFGILA